MGCTDRFFVDPGLKLKCLQVKMCLQIPDKLRRLLFSQVEGKARRTCALTRCNGTSQQVVI